MIFEALFEASKKGELLLIDGGFCHWHLRKDGQLTIREIISIKPGAGTEMLNYLKQVKNAQYLVAKCPTDLESNSWYRKKGFKLIGREFTKNKKEINVWKLFIVRVEISG